MKFGSTIAAVLLALPLMAAAAAASTAACRPVCCDAFVASITPPGKIGIDCTFGGFDCGFSGQVRGCCAAIVPIGANPGTAVGCE